MAASNYPEISPTHFSLIVSGTSLSSSLLAAAAASASKSVLHVDPNSFYGSQSSTLSLSLFHDLLHLPQPLPELSRKLLLDVSAPKLLFCADSMVDVLIRSGGSNHVEFKGVDCSLIYEDGKLCTVPDSRQAIFKDKSLRLAEKREMMKFLKVVQGHFGNGDSRDMVKEEDLELPFVEFLKKQGLPSRISSIILYAIVMADWDQERKEECKKVIKTKEGLESIALYSKSVARFQNAAGAFIYPMYGLGELPQAFCRIAAVKGALYVLRMPVTNILVDEETKKYKGVKLASGQEIYSEHLIMEPTSIHSSSVLSSSNCDESSKVTEMVVRGVCVTSSSVHQDSSNVLVIFPPRSLHSDQLATVRALQLSSNVAVCPHGQFVVYLSTPCSDAAIGKKYIHAAMNALFSYASPNNSEDMSSNNKDEEAYKPNILWSSIYVQDITQVSFDTFYTPPPLDASLDYRDLLESTMKLFKQIYPEEEFLPPIRVSEDSEEDNGSSE